MAVYVPPFALTQTMFFTGERLLANARRVQVLDQLVVPWAFDSISSGRVMIRISCRDPLQNLPTPRNQNGGPGQLDLLVIRVPHSECVDEKELARALNKEGS